MGGDYRDGIRRYGHWRVVRVRRGRSPRLGRHGLGVQHYSIAPTEREARRRLDEAKRLTDQSPDIERAFDALIFAGDEAEATRRYKRWEAYLVDFEEKIRQFFNRYAGGR
jgi:hypothetical protein